MSDLLVLVYLDINQIIYNYSPKLIIIMNYGYIRVSTSHQVTDNQKNEIENFATLNNFTIDNWVVEVVSGTKKESERELGNLLKKLKTDDQLFITEISRLSRKLMGVMTIVGQLIEKGVILYSTKDHYVFDNSINSKVLCFAFGLVAEIERNLIVSRTKEALMLRKQQGVQLGRPTGRYSKSNILSENNDDIVEMLDAGCHYGEICEKYNVSRTTLYKYLKANQ